MSIASKLRWEDPVYAEKISEAGKLRWEDPEYIEEMTKASKLLWKDPEYIKKTIKGMSMKPTRPEKHLDELLQYYLPGQYKYNGDYSLGCSIGGRIPDFVNINSQKKVIEMYGDYWHKGENPQDKIDQYLVYGWFCLIIWEHELKDEDEVVKKILKFDETHSEKHHKQLTLNDA